MRPQLSTRATIALSTIAIIVTLIGCTWWLEGKIEGNADMLAMYLREVRDAAARR